MFAFSQKYKKAHPASHTHTKKSKHKIKRIDFRKYGWYFKWLFWQTKFASKIFNRINFSIAIFFGQCYANIIIFNCHCLFKSTFIVESWFIIRPQFQIITVNIIKMLLYFCHRHLWVRIVFVWNIIVIVISWNCHCQISPYDMCWLIVVQNLNLLAFGVVVMTFCCYCYFFILFLVCSLTKTTNFQTNNKGSKFNLYCDKKCVNLRLFKTDSGPLNSRGWWKKSVSSIDTCFSAHQAKFIRDSELHLYYFLRISKLLVIIDAINTATFGKRMFFYDLTLFG